MIMASQVLLPLPLPLPLLLLLLLPLTLSLNVPESNKGLYKSEDQVSHLTFNQTF